MADTLDQNFESSIGNEFFGFPNRDYVFQSFTTSVAGRFTKFGFKLKVGAGSPNGTLTGYLYNDNGGEPGSVLSTLSNFSASTLTGSHVWYYWTKAIKSAYGMAAGIKYHLVVHSSIVDGGNYVHIDAGTGYGGGSGGIGDATPTWSSFSVDDCLFRQYYDILPSGFSIFLLEAYQKGKKYFEKKNGLYLPVKPKGILVPEGI